MAKQNKIDIDQLIGLNQSDNAFIETEDQRTNTTLTEHFGFKLAHTTPKVATLNVEGFRTTLKGEDSATPYTVTNFSHYRAQQYTLGTNQTVTNNYGFYAGAPLTFGSNNYGFYSNISSFTNRWNFYSNGTAPNYFNGDVRTNTTFLKNSSQTNENTSVIATVSSLISGIRTGIPTADITLTLPTGVNMDSFFQNLQVSQSFEWSYINLVATTYTVTILGNTNHTLIGDMVVQPNTSARFLTRKSSTNTFITYRIA